MQTQNYKSKHLESSEILFSVVIARNEMTACPEVLFRESKLDFDSIS
jgi:hypothetical protein